MAPKAYLRCRSCGEPLYTNVARCPYCGADLPTAPVTPQGRADPAEWERNASFAAPPSGLRATRVPAAAIENGRLEPWLEGAAADDFDPVDRREPRFGDAQGAWPGSDETGLESYRNGHRFEPVSGASHPGGFVPAGAEDGGPGLPVPGRSEQAASGGATIYVLPTDRFRRRRRSRFDAAVGILLVLVVVVAGIGWWASRGGLASLGVDPAAVPAPLRRLFVPKPTPVRLEASTTWRSLLPQPPVADVVYTIETTAPIRVRAGGNVFTIAGGHTVRLPIAAGDPVEVRAVEGTSVMTVRPVPRPG